MDIDFIEQEHRSDIFKIMQLCNVDMTQAYHLYHVNECNFQKAIQANFLAHEQKFPEVKPVQQQHYQGYKQLQDIHNIYGNSFGNNNKILHNAIYGDYSSQQKLPQSQLQQYYDYDSRQFIPLNQKPQDKKLKQDRQIRKKQQQQFYQTMNHKKVQEDFKKYTENKAADMEKIKKQEMQNRNKIRQNINQHKLSDKIISIKFRLPSSQVIQVNVNANQKAQYLYDLIYSREQDLGFEQDQLKRVFDIIQPYDKINLSGKKNQTLQHIFQGNTMLSLVVSEIH